MVSLDDADAGRVVLAADNSRVGARRERLQDRGFLQIAGWNSSLLDRLSLGILPVIVRCHDAALAVVEFESRVPCWDPEPGTEQSWSRFREQWRRR